MSITIPADLLPPDPSESPEARFARRIRTADLLRRRRRLAGLTHRQVAHAAMVDGSRISRYEQGWQYPGPQMVERILTAIARLEKDGAGNQERAEEARAEYEAQEGTGEAAE